MGDFNVTGLGFVTATVVVTVLVFLASVVLVPRMQKPGIRKYLVQALSLLLTAVLLLVSVGAILNRENDWYTSWKAIFAGNPSDQAVASSDYGAKQPRTVAASAVHQQATELQQNPQDNPAFGGRIDTHEAKGQYVPFTVAGENSGQTFDAMMWLPPSYFSHPDRFYPVIMAFTGFPGSPQTYMHSVDYGQMVENTVHEGKISESIVIIPNVMPGKYDTECVDATRTGKAQTPKAETYITEDFVPWLKKNLRTIDDRQAWATEGYSAGGWCSAMLTLRHPDLFGAGMIQSGYFEPDYTAGQVWTDEDDPRYDLERIAQEQRPDVRLHYFSSVDDTLSWPTTQQFRKKVHPPTSLTTDTIAVGGHRLSVWLPGMERSLEWLGAGSKYFAPHRT